MPCAHVHVRRKGKWDWLALCHFVHTYRYRDRSLDILYRSCNIARFVSSLGIADIGFAYYRCQTNCPHCKSTIIPLNLLFFSFTKKLSFLKRNFFKYYRYFSVQNVFSAIGVRSLNRDNFIDRSLKEIGMYTLSKGTS